MRAKFDASLYAKKVLDSGKLFHTFISTDTLEAGVLCLKRGQQDTQEPHDSDEVYYVVRGSGYLQIGKKEYKVGAGKAFFVKAGIPHRFFGNSGDLVVLYFFGAS